MAKKNANTIKINEVDYDVDTLSDEAKSHIANIRFTDGLISRLRGELAVAETARAGYSNALRAALDASEKSAD